MRKIIKMRDLPKIQQIKILLALDSNKPTKKRKPLTKKIQSKVQTNPKVDVTRKP